MRQCKKFGYTNEALARRMLKKVRRRRFEEGLHPDTWEKNVYLCKYCAHWHLTHIREKDYLTRNRKK